MRYRYFATSAILIVTATAQEHPYSNAYAYYTTAVTPNLEFTATTYASTGGTETHVMSQIGVFVQSPAGRTASAYEYPEWPSGQATAYLPLCAGDNCEDGTFFVSTGNTAERCGVTGQTLTVPVQSGPKEVLAWVTWTDQTMMEPGAMPVSSGESVFKGKLQKSNSCHGVSAISMELWKQPENILASYSPFQNQAATFTKNKGTVEWTVRTNMYNSITGKIFASAGIEATACEVKGSPLKQAAVQVQ
jgi:hypothetical protein